MSSEYINLEGNRGSGRTTRMVFAAAAYLVKHDADSVTLYAHNNCGIAHLRSVVTRLLSPDLASRFKYGTYGNWSMAGIGKRDDYFFDHHCYYEQLVVAKKAFDSIQLLHGEWDEH